MTVSACLVQVAVISFRYLARGSPSFFCSGIATAMLPPSSTTWPIASRRASSPATRTAEGPMSTPRRAWPKSSGTPKILILLGTMLSAAAGFGAISALGRVSTFVFSGVIEFQFCRSFSRRAGSGFRPSTSLRPGLRAHPTLRIDAGQSTSERNCFADVFQAADPSDGALNSHSETGMRHTAVLAQIQIPFEGFFRKVVFLNALTQQVVIADALRSADDLAV